MFQTLSELTTYFIHQVIEESEEINEFNDESRPLVYAGFLRLYSALCYVERYSQEFNAELHAISKEETPLTKVVIHSKNKKLFASIENFNFQLLNLEYLGNYHINSFSLQKHNRKAVWHYPDEWRIDVHDWIIRNFNVREYKHMYSIYPFILTSPVVELSEQIAILKYPTKIPNASEQAEVVAELPIDNKLSFGHCVHRGASGAYEHVLSGENSYRLLAQSVYNLLEIQEIDLRSTTILKLLVEDAQSSVEAIASIRHALGCFIKQSFELNKILI